MDKGIDLTDRKLSFEGIRTSCRDIGTEYGNHSHTQLCDIMVPRFPIPEELRRKYEDYLVSSRTPE